jgi:hypothetical protein
MVILIILCPHAYLLSSIDISSSSSFTASYADAHPPYSHGTRRSHVSLFQSNPPRRMRACTYMCSRFPCVSRSTPNVDSFYKGQRASGDISGFCIRYDFVATALVTTARFIILQSKTMRHLPGVSKELFSRMVKCLHQISLSADENVSRCARVISGFFGRVEQ